MKVQGWKLALIATSLFAPSVVRADALPFPAREVTPQLRFESLSDYPDVDFYLKYGRSPGNPFAALYLTPVSRDGVTSLEGKGRRITAVVLLAVRRGEQLPQVGSNPEWLTERTPGIVQSEPLANLSGGYTIDDSLAAAVVPYRVRLQGDMLEVTALPVEPLPGSVGPGWLTYVVAGGALSLGVGAAGLWFISRQKRRQ